MQKRTGGNRCAFERRTTVLITDKFVFIHMPKTGGTFVSSTLLRIHSSYLDLPHDYFFSTPPKKLKLVSRNVTENFDSPKYGSVVNQAPEARKVPPNSAGT